MLQINIWKEKAWSFGANETEQIQPNLLQLSKPMISWKQLKYSSMFVEKYRWHVLGISRIFVWLLPTPQEMSNLFSIWCESMAIRPCRKVRTSWKRSEWSEWSDLFSSGASGSFFKAFWLAMTSSHHIRCFSILASCWFLLSTLPKPRLTDSEDCRKVDQAFSIQKDWCHTVTQRMSRLQWTQKLLERITVQNQATHRGWSYLPHSKTADSKNEHATHWNVFDYMIALVALARINESVSCASKDPPGQSQPGARLLSSGGLWLSCIVSNDVKCSFDLNWVLVNANSPKYWVVLRLTLA